jgi:hypothetical protein
MRQPKHLSPTSLSLFWANPEEYYMQYLSDYKLKRPPQTQPMAVGSAFDAYAKSYLHGRLFGEGSDPRFEFTSIFEAQVEPHNRDWAKIAGEYAFQKYRECGALADLMLDLQKASLTPRFEFSITGVISGHREGVTRDFGGVPLNGKPDIFYINRHGAHVNFDWKVSGYCSDHPPSPMKGYVNLRENGKGGQQHRGSAYAVHNGTMVNAGLRLEDCNKDWAAQLAIYEWLCGEDIGGDFIAAIDQLVCKKMEPRPHIRVAEHRLLISKDYQWATFQNARMAWEIINSDHFFRSVTKEDSQAKCKLLDGVAEDLSKPQTELDAWHAEASGR